MASIRKRTWQTKDGERTAWICDYFDGAGKRRLKTFSRKKDAADWLAHTHVEVKAGEHVADRASVTVAVAAAAWLDTCRHGRPDDETGGLEASTVREYERHVRYITDPEIGIGQVKLNQLSKAVVEAFLKRLRDCGRSASMARKVRTSLSSLIGHAQERGQVGRNVLRDERRRRRGPREQREIVIPTKAELRAMLNADGPLWFRTFLAIAIYTGLRASEIRGLPWGNVDLEAGIIRVRQRADFAGRIGPPKSRAGNRDVPMVPTVRRLLQELYLAQGRPDADALVFATKAGTPIHHSNLVQRFYDPLQDRLGISPRYGLHALRHAAASLFIEQGMNPKRVQVLMGHSSITMTMDVYGKLFPDGNGDQAAMAQLEALLG